MTKNINQNWSALKLFDQPFLKTFSLASDLLPLDESFLKSTDSDLAVYENSSIDWRLEESLRSRNNLLASYAVSKAEQSALTLAEAQEVYELIIKQPQYDFLREKLTAGRKLTTKDHDRLEYFNIVKVFRRLDHQGFQLGDLTPDFIIKLHQELTAGLDVFDGQLTGFEPYHSGHWRADDLTRVGDFQPAPHQEIKSSVEELIGWLKQNPSALNVFVFHAALYAVHPFKNGNKRVCRVLEHILLRAIGYNEKNLYSTSAYYHKHRDKYYKNLLETLYKHNFNPVVALAAEALFFSVVGVVAGVLQRKKLEFLQRSGLEKEVIAILKPLAKRQEINFSRLFALNKRKLARQTFSNYLQAAVASGFVQRRPIGRNAYYSLTGHWVEQEQLTVWLKSGRDVFGFLPNELAGY